MLRRFSVNFAVFSMFLDAFVVFFSLKLSADFRPFLNGFLNIAFVPTPVLVPPVLYLVFPLIWLVVFSSFAIYDGKKYLRVVDEFSALSLATLIASISSAGILYFSFRDVSRAHFLFFISLAYLLFLAWRVVVRLHFRFNKSWLNGRQRALIVGAGPLGKKVEKQIEKSNLENLSLVGFVDDFQKFTAEENLLGNQASIRTLAIEHQVSDVIIALPHSAYQQLGEIVQSLDDLPLRIWIALGFFDLALYRTRIEDFAGIPMLDLRASAIDDYQRLMKRGFDFVIGGALLLLSSPVMAIVSLLLIIDDGFPVLFRQKRVGENGKLFGMYKFRTMIKNAEQVQSQVATHDEQGNEIHKREGDPRVTHIGRILRRYSLDELPQFFNVVRGDMSLVGPRPEMPYLVEKYQPWQRKRFAVPPGLTGWWQVSGRSDKPMHLNTEDDLYYISNYSLWLDIQILMRTIWVVLIGKGAY